MNPFLALQNEVQGIMEAGRPLECAEERINDPGQPLSDDERAAVWIYAWSLQAPHWQHYNALRYLEGLD